MRVRARASTPAGARGSIALQEAPGLLEPGPAVRGEAVPLSRADAGREADRQRLEPLCCELPVAERAGSLQESLALGVGGGPPLAGGWPALRGGEAHGGQPLRDERARELGEHARLRGHDVAHLPQQDVGDLVVRLGGDASLVVLHGQSHDLLHGRLRLRQGPPLQQQPAHLVVLSAVLRRHEAQPLRHEGAAKHAVCHAQAVGHHAVAVGLLEGVGHGVAVLEDHAAVVLVRIHLQHGHLRLKAQANEAHERLPVQHKLLTGAAVRAVDALLGQRRHETLQVLAAEECRVLRQLADAREELAAGQRAAEAGVNEKLLGGVEGANVVLLAIVTDGSLEGCHYVVHGEQRRRYVHELRAAVEDRGEEAHDV
mmetsp:Transcript_36964/g.110396  ORF Transcript_36964/g.110396 Transcript_36964/m.110396 type:complete len:370 (-) Transcript_36964:507-1616(-)